MKGVARLLFLGLLVAGCPAQPPGVFVEAGYHWEANPRQPDCPEVFWFSYTPTDLMAICGAGLVGCGDGRSCVVASMYDEKVARTVFISGTPQSHYTHEVDMHIHRKLQHPKG